MPPTKRQARGDAGVETEASQAVRGARIRSATRVYDIATQKESKPPPRPWPSIHPAMVLCRYEVKLIVDARTETSPCSGNRDRQAGVSFSSTWRVGGAAKQPPRAPIISVIHPPSGRPSDQMRAWVAGTWAVRSLGSSVYQRVRYTPLPRTRCSIRRAKAGLLSNPAHRGPSSSPH